MNWKRALSGMIAGALLCAAAASASADDVVIKVWSRADRSGPLRAGNIVAAGDTLNKMLAAAGADKRVKIELNETNAKGYDDDALDLLKAFAVDKGPDIFVLAHEWTGAFAEAGYALNLEDHIGKNPELYGDIIVPLWQSVSYKGARYGVPQDSEVRMYFLNNDKLHADAIRQEVAALIAAGCEIVQFDDPVLLRYPDAAQAWGLHALERCFAGLEDRATFVVHICRGYPNKPLERKGIAYKANQDYYRDILAWLSESKLDVVSIEGAASKLDVSILSAIGDKTVMLGVIDVGENDVESVETLVARANEALRYIPIGQLMLAPDCGMLELTHASARKKLANLALAAREVNENAFIMSKSDRQG